MAFISLQELNKHNSPKNIVFLLSLIRLDFIATLFHHAVENADITWIHITALVGGFGLISNYYSLAPLNTPLPMSLRLLLLLA